MRFAISSLIRVTKGIMVDSILIPILAQTTFSWIMKIFQEN